MKRTKHSLSHYHLLTCDMGEIVPIAHFEVLPGDSVQQATSLLVRVSPLLAPVMHPVTVRVHHWFVPYRILWDEWEAFITGGTDGLGDGYTYPEWTGTPTAGQLEDYLGVPPGINHQAAGGGIGMLPIYAYNKIFNEFYSDQDLFGEVALDNRVLLKCAWEKDRFTAARPWTQKGPDVSLPLGTEAPVLGIGKADQTYGASGGNRYETAGTGATTFTNESATSALNNFFVEEDPNNAGFPYVRADLSSATAATVNEIREAFAKQRYMEARAQYGSRYTEYLRFLGVRSSDARLQRPEYLGGGKQTISFSEVLQTGVDSLDAGLGNLGGHGIAAVRSNRYRRFFEEHGVVMSLLSVRPRAMYTQGVHKSFRRRTKEDYYQRELEAIGQEEVHKGELYAQGDANDVEVFGYNDRYSSYRHEPSRVSGEFRGGAGLDHWHMGRVFAAEPTLNADFITCSPTKRIHAVTSNDVLWVMANHSIQARRMVGKNAIGRLF